MNPTNEELIRMEVERQLKGAEQAKVSDLNSHLMSLGGGVVGGGVGLLAINPVDTFLENRTVRKAALNTQDKDLLYVLLGLENGSIQWDEIDDPATEKALLKLKKKKQSILNDPKALQQELSAMERNNVYRLTDLATGVEGKEHVKRYLKDTKNKRMIPETDFIRNLSRLSHPMVSMGGLAGMAGGYLLADQLAKKNLTENK